jgi:hypothetical protein
MESDPQERTDVGLGSQMPGKNQVVGDAFFYEERSEADPAVLDASVHDRVREIASISEFQECGPFWRRLELV